MRATPVRGSVFGSSVMAGDIMTNVIPARLLARAVCTAQRRDGGGSSGFCSLCAARAMHRDAGNEILQAFLAGSLLMVNSAPCSSASRLQIGKAETHSSFLCFKGLAIPAKGLQSERDVLRLHADSGVPDDKIYSSVRRGRRLYRDLPCGVNDRVVDEIEQHLRILVSSARMMAARSGPNPSASALPSAQPAS